MGEAERALCWDLIEKYSPTKTKMALYMFGPAAATLVSPVLRGVFISKARLINTAIIGTGTGLTYNRYQLKVCEKYHGNLF